MFLMIRMYFLIVMISVVVTIAVIGVIVMIIMMTLIGEVFIKITISIQHYTYFLLFVL